MQLLCSSQRQVQVPFFVFLDEMSAKSGSYTHLWGEVSARLVSRYGATGCIGNL